jgi:hypothetical protein
MKMNHVRITRDRHKDLFWEIAERCYHFFPCVCTDPLCPRTEVDCTLATQGESLTSYRFILDWRARGAIKTEYIDERSRVLLDELASAFDDRFWGQLSGVFQMVKDRIGDDFTSDDTVYEPPTVSRGKMVSYRKVVPFARRLVLPFLRAKHDLADHYCVNPSCECTTVTVDFHLREGNTIHVDPRHPSVSLDYERGTFETVGNPYGIEEKLVEELLRRTTLVSRLRRRHATLRALYRAKPERIGEPDPSPPPVESPGSMPSPEKQASESEKIGRNDPCPCGSGKKYKKCCMR